MVSFVKTFSVVFLLSVSVVNWVKSSGTTGYYNKLRHLGMLCYPTGSCQRSNYQTGLEESKICECDAACYRRGTCCIDSPYINARPSTRSETCSDHITVSGFFSSSPHTGLFQVAQCDRGWNGSLQIKQLCEMEKPVNGTDLWIAIPVTNTRSKTTYRNYFCAVCNNDIEDAVFWDFLITHDEKSHSILYNRFTIEATDEINDTTNSGTEGSGSCAGTNASPFVFNEGRSWGYWDHCSNSTRFVPVLVQFVPPITIVDLVKMCIPTMTSSCPPDWTDVEVKTLCGSYLGVIKGPPRYTQYSVHYDQYFRNAHCALCNNVTNFKGYSCEQFLWTPPGVMFMSASLLFGHSLWDKKCPKSNENYIEGLGCRLIICAPEYKRQNAKCIRE